jgi:hypothetical protein
VKYTAAEIEELIATARAANLEGVELLESDSPAEIAKLCNGVGPDSWGEEARDIVTKFLHYFEAPAAIHDVAHSKADGSRYNFEYNNAVFYNNCMKMSRYYVPWWRPFRRATCECAALGCYKAVSSPFGWDAYVKATSKG